MVIQLGKHYEKKTDLSEKLASSMTRGGGVEISMISLARVSWVRYEMSMTGCTWIGNENATRMLFHEKKIFSNHSRPTGWETLLVLCYNHNTRIYLQHVYVQGYFKERFGFISCYKRNNNRIKFPRCVYEILCTTKQCDCEW